MLVTQRENTSQSLYNLLGYDPRTFYMEKQWISNTISGSDHDSGPTQVQNLESTMKLSCINLHLSQNLHQGAVCFIQIQYENRSIHGKDSNLNITHVIFTYVKYITCLSKLLFSHEQMSASNNLYFNF